MSYNNRVRWLSNDQSVTGYPVGTRLSHVLKVGEQKKDNAPMLFSWLSAEDARYKSITLADARSGAVVPTVERVFSDFKLCKMMYAHLPDAEVIEQAIEGSIVPSVTTVPGFLFRDDGLARWKLNLQLDYLREITGGQLPDDDAQWDGMKKTVANYENTFYAERGTRWHTAIEHLIRGDELVPLPGDEADAFSIAASTIMRFVEQLPSADLERSFVHEDGYGGTVDFRSGNIVLDWKTKDKPLFTKAGGIYSSIIQPEYSTQLAAYAKGLEVDSPRLINAFINVTNGDVGFYEYSDPHHAAMMWESQLLTWQLKINPALSKGVTLRV